MKKTKLKAYKGFNADMTCRGFQFEEGKEYVYDGEVKCCNSGFHACEHPLDCLNYYSPNDSVYHEVELDGTIDREAGGDTKVAAKEIKIGERLDIAGLVKAAVDFTLSRAKKVKGSSVKKDYGAASATGVCGAASATGDYGAASAKNQSSIAVSWGRFGKAKGVKNAHIVLAEWGEWDGEEFPLLCAKMVVVDGEKIKEDTYYTLKNGEFVEA